MSFKTEQEEFWAGDFGNEYIDRNNSDQYLASNLNFFTKVFRRIDKPQSLIEFGANIGMNLKAIQLIIPDIDLSGIEINEMASKELSALIGESNVFNCSILDFNSNKTYDVSLIKGVLIHINPSMLQTVYEKLYNSSNKYILIAEYFNPSPVTVTYRGHTDRLFKRDFAGDMLDLYDNLTLLDYGFIYSRDKLFPQDDVNWFLLEKK